MPEKDDEELRKKRSAAGKIGGPARARALSKKRRVEIAKKAASARTVFHRGPIKSPEEKLQNVPCRILPLAIEQLNEIAETLDEKRGRILERIIAKEHKRVTKG